jgi:hypothetical protein
MEVTDAPTSCDADGAATVDKHESDPAATDAKPIDSEPLNRVETKRTRRKRGAQPRNKYAMRHGLQSGMLPDGCGFITKQSSTFRRAVESAVLATRGQLGVYEVALIQSASTWYVHGLKARRWLRVAFDQLSNDQRVAFSREEARAFSERDRILKQLGLDQGADSSKMTLYALPFGDQSEAAGDARRDQSDLSPIAPQTGQAQLDECSPPRPVQ